MPPDTATGWSLVAVAPRVDRRHRNSEIVGKVFNGEQPINGFMAESCDGTLAAELTSMSVGLSPQL